jgi:hypothetical protein
MPGRRSGEFRALNPWRFEIVVILDDRAERKRQMRATASRRRATPQRARSSTLPWYRTGPVGDPS